MANQYGGVNSDLVYDTASHLGMDSVGEETPLLSVKNRGWYWNILWTINFVFILHNFNNCFEK